MSTSEPKIWDVPKLRATALSKAMDDEWRIDVEMLVGVIDQLSRERDEAQRGCQSLRLELEEARQRATKFEDALTVSNNSCERRGVRIAQLETAAQTALDFGETTPEEWASAAKKIHDALNPATATAWLESVAQKARAEERAICDIEWNKATAFSSNPKTPSMREIIDAHDAALKKKWANENDGHPLADAMAYSASPTRHRTRGTSSSARAFPSRHALKVLTCARWNSGGKPVAVHYHYEKLGVYNVVRFEVGKPRDPKGHGPFEHYQKGSFTKDEAEIHVARLNATMCGGSKLRQISPPNPRFPAGQECSGCADCKGTTP